MDKKTIVIALGGNAIAIPSQKGTFKEQYDHIRSACVPVVRIIQEGHRVVLTHGSGPQVGNLLLQVDMAAGQVPVQPMDICSAMVQGQVGYMIQQALSNTFVDLGIKVDTIALVSRVLVSPDDPAFTNPSKPVGPFYTKDQAERLAARRRYVFKQMDPADEKSYRRIVPCPYPLAMVDQETIKRLLDMGMVVVAGGGGGVPVFIRDNGHFHGTEAVVDKDLCAAKMGEVVRAEILMILTDTPHVYLHFRGDNQTRLTAVKVADMKKHLVEGHFLAGTMQPKVEACVRFIESGGERAMIAHLESAVEALRGEAGTQITR
jgi:carbamate kinase